jgi:PAS domain S-box-containing protein
MLRDRALEGTSQGITIADTKAGGKIIYTNPAFAELTGYATDEIIGRTFNSFFSADAAREIDNRFRKAYVDKKPLRGEVIFHRKDGSSFRDSMAAALIYDADGSVSHAVVIHDDVTETRQRDEMLLEAQKMESLGQLTGGIAHDFNNLLTAVQSNAEDLRDDLADNPLLQSQAEIILEAAMRGAGLVAQLTAFARKQELQPQSLCVNTLLAGIDQLLRSSLPAHIDLRVVPCANLPRVHVDPARLESAILSLLLNARDAIQESGAVTIETSVSATGGDDAGADDAEKGPYVVITVTDTGDGMPPHVLERAFQPFFTTKEVGKGTGLGLSMVYGFAKQSGGYAHIASEEGVGTVVKIYLPIERSDAKEDIRALARDGRDTAAARILLVEDDPIVRESIGRKLVRLGHDVTAATSGAEALDILKRDAHFDLVFSDVIMPGRIDGAALAGEVRQHWPDIAVLLTSGYTESAVLGKVKMPAGVPLLSKPYSNADLVRAIAQALAHRHPAEKADAT